MIIHLTKQPFRELAELPPEEQISKGWIRFALSQRSIQNVDPMAGMGDN
jgi:hypothetical protein